MITQNDIATKLGLNKTTVSKALRGSNDISEDTRARVIEAARELGYKKTFEKTEAPVGRPIAILCPEIVSHYYSQVATSLFEQLKAQGHSPVIFITDFDAKREEDALTEAARLSARGVIFMTERADITPIARRALGATRTPLVIMGLNYEAGEYDVVSVNEQHGIVAAVEHLIGGGRKRLAYIGDKYGEKRRFFMREAARACGVSLHQEYVSEGGLRHEACGYEGMKELLKAKQPPDAVFAEYDTIALGAYRAIYEAGLVIPDDIAVVGFDNAPLCRYLPVALSSIDNHIGDMCNITLAILKRKIADPEFKVVQTVAITPVYIPRESSR